MRSYIISTLFLALLILTSCGGSKQKANDNPNSGTVNISGAFALYPITVLWAEKFMEEYPDIRINISAGGAGKGMADALSGMVDLGMFSREVSQPEIEKGAWYIAVTKDAVLPTINSKNPFFEDLQKRGITKEQFYQIFVTGEITNWNELYNQQSLGKINIFTRSDACGAAAMWAKYLDASQEELLGTGVFGDPGVADAVKRNIYGIGYNNVIYVYDIQTRKKYPGMEIIPIDLNNDGLINKNENFYATLDEISAAIKEGKYPAPPARDLYFVSNGKPKNEAALHFMNWVLTNGQQYIHQAGYVNLSKEQINGELKKLNIQ